MFVLYYLFMKQINYTEIEGIGTHGFVVAVEAALHELRGRVPGRALPARLPPHRVQVPRGRVHYRVAAAAVLETTPVNSSCAFCLSLSMSFPCLSISISRENISTSSNYLYTYILSPQASALGMYNTINNILNLKKLRSAVNTIVNQGFHSRPSRKKHFLVGANL